MFDYNHRKAVQILNYFAICDGGIINKMKSVKLIWLSDRAHLRRYGRPIIMDEYYALPYGPVPSNTKDLAENNSFSSEDEVNYRDKYISVIDKYNYKSVNEVEKKVFSETDLLIMKNIYSEFGMFNEFQLTELSHNYPEWKRFEIGLKNKTVSRYPMDYLDFFENPSSDNGKIFSEPTGLLELSKEIFTENIEIAHGIY